jgi:coniferyl-aldehyde dehydrogenase
VPGLRVRAPRRAIARGARKIEAVSDADATMLRDRDSRRTAPTLPLGVPAEAKITNHEIFGPVLVLYPYDEVDEAIDYINSSPSPLAAFWYGEDGPDFQRLSPVRPAEV